VLSALNDQQVQTVKMPPIAEEKQPEKEKSWLENLAELVATQGFGKFQHPRCSHVLLVQQGELLLDHTLPEDFFSRKPEVPLTGWQELPFPKAQDLTTAVDASSFFAYLLLCQKVAMTDLVDPQQAVLLKKFPSFIFNLHFQSAWSSPEVRNHLMRTALKMQKNSAGQTAYSPSLLLAENIPATDVKKFFNLLFFLDYIEKIHAEKAAMPTSPKNRLTSQIRKHLGLTTP
jgi:hypothetical protein